MSSKRDGQEKHDPARRNFLRAGLVGAAAAGTASGAAIAPARAAESDGDKKKARYKETDHVKKYYATNRY